MCLAIIDTGRVAFCRTENISTPNLSYAAQYLACALPCEFFTSALADNPCITRGQCGSLLLHDGLPPSAFRRSPAGLPAHPSRPSSEGAPATSASGSRPKRVTSARDAPPLPAPWSVEETDPKVPAQRRHRRRGFRTKEIERCTTLPMLRFPRSILSLTSLGRGLADLVDGDHYFDTTAPMRRSSFGIDFLAIQQRSWAVKPSWLCMRATERVWRCMAQARSW